MGNAGISYVIHIATTPEKLWEVLTSPEALRKNWGIIESPWTPGSTVMEVDDSGKLLWKGKVLRSERPHLLSFSFEVAGIDESPTEARFELSRPVSKVGGNVPVVRLTVTQTGFKENSPLAADCARAWSEIMSSVKSYVETGRPIPFDWKH